MPYNHSCTPEEAIRLFRAHEHCALLDVREQGEFFRDHALPSSCAPLSRLEFMAPLLVPGKGVLILLMDSGEKDDRRAQKAAEALRAMGYVQPLVIEGGISGWRKAGFVTVEGGCIIAKSYAEYLEQGKSTPGLTPEGLKELLERGEKMALIDIREPGEYAGVSLPGGVNAPGCESAYRFLDLVSSPDTFVVVNCAARTRGILCAQMLLDLGVPNPVAYLKGGVMNWKRSGYAVEIGRGKRTAPPSRNALEFAAKRADTLARRYGVGFVDMDTLAQWETVSDSVPLYLFDVRQPEESAAGHLSGSRCVPGGQLAQCINEHAAVRTARFVLIDDTEARAVITAYWLKLLGMANVFVLKGGLGGSKISRGGLETGLQPHPPVQCSFQEGITAQELAERLAGETPPLVINVGYSDKHRSGHIPGAVWAARSRLDRLFLSHSDAAGIVLTSDCETHAKLAAADARQLRPAADVRFLRGGTPEWEKDRFPMEAGMPAACGAEDDVSYLVYKDPNAQLGDMESYFDWKNELADKLLRDGSLDFRLP